MEDTLRDGSMLRHNKLQDVLILVLMEDTLRVETWVKKEDTATVLILVLMEDTLRGHRSLRYHYQTLS